MRRFGFSSGYVVKVGWLSYFLDVQNASTLTDDRHIELNIESRLFISLMKVTRHLGYVFLAKMQTDKSHL